MLNQNPVDGECAASSVLTRFHAAISYLTGGEMIVDQRSICVGPNKAPLPLVCLSSGTQLREENEFTMVS